ncbi:hypothetical protein [Clostridium sp. UBA1652]|uniref:hypothetical protein n=1 Tax=Clostridium sp. UBA1652 TaxID=1946348 RepID=UPI00257F002D|nr:hypothetical protein [Clostridium sp. UBA1652]
MIFITYYKSDGKITAPCIASEVEQSFKDVFGERADDMNLIYDSININLKDSSKEISFLNEVIRGAYKVDVVNKKLVKIENEIEYI